MAYLHLFTAIFLMLAFLFFNRKANTPLLNITLVLVIVAHLFICAKAFGLI